MKTKILIGVGCLLGLFDNAMGAWCDSVKTCCDSGTCITNGCYETVPAAQTLRGNGFICENVRPNSTCTCTKDGSTTVYPMYCQTNVDCAPGYKCGANWECVWDDSDNEDLECRVDEDCEYKADPWEEAYDPGFQVRTHLGCDDVCVETRFQDVRCIAGYWGQPDTPTEDDPMGCYPCPTLLGYAGLSINGAQYQTQCYIAEGQSLTDNTGTFEFTSDCYYTN